MIASVGAHSGSQSVYLGRIIKKDGPQFIFIENYLKEYSFAA